MLNKIFNLLFYLMNKSHFKVLQKGVVIKKPLRLDGKKNISIYKNTVIQKHSWLFAQSFDGSPVELVIGEGCAIGYFNHITAVRKVIIGQKVLTANGVYISDNLHNFEDTTLPVLEQGVRFKSEVEIGDGSWIGENACIIGCKIGKNCVVAANAVVTKDIPDYSIAAGVPAVIIKRYRIESGKWEKTEPGGKFIRS